MHLLPAVFPFLSHYPLTTGVSWNCIQNTLLALKLLSQDLIVEEIQSKIDVVLGSRTSGWNSRI